jgi:N-formylglutamate deformylase
MIQDTPSFGFSAGTLPLLISIPHLGAAIPDELRAAMTAVAALRQDTDWHLDRLYAFAQAMGASVLRAQVSRYVIDLNRPPDGRSLYPGRTTTGLCPTETFRGEPLYPPGCCGRRTRSPACCRDCSTVACRI